MTFKQWWARRCTQRTWFDVADPRKLAQEAWNAGQAAEREACAASMDDNANATRKLFRTKGKDIGEDYLEGRASAFMDAAAAIRARGEGER